MLWKVISTILVGALCGWIAGKIMKSSGSFLRNVILGIVGGFIGGLIGMILPLSAIFGWIGSLVLGVAGACLCIWLARKFLK